MGTGKHNIPREKRLYHWLRRHLLPESVSNLLDRRLPRYLALVLLFTGLSAALLALVYMQMTGGGADGAAIAPVLRNVFFASAILIAIAAWRFILAREASRAAQRETSHQTAMLLAEIKAHRRTDQQLQRARELADSRNVAKSKYVRGLSHELRTPLNAVLGYAQLLEQDGALPDTMRHSVKVIRRSGDHLASLVDGLLDISMIEAGRLQVMKEEVQLPSFLAQIVDMVRLQARDAGLTFAYEAPPNLPGSVHSDEKRLRQILINLLSNAIRYTDSGTVTLRITHTGQVARFDIIDTGLGIAPQDLKRIFEPFERVEHPGRAAVTGSGLGLTITRLLTEALGGELTVSSVPGQGSTFSVRLMLAPVPATRRVTSDRDRVIEGYRGARRTILAVDDDSRQTELLRAALGRIGFKVETENSGTAGVERALALNPDVVLLDISMPGMSGWDVAREIRAGMVRHVPIIMISAYAPESGAQPPLHDDYLMKPLRLERLLESLHRLLDIEWISRAADQPPPRTGMPGGEKPAPQHLEALAQLGKIGHLRGILLKLDEIGAQQPDAAPILAALRRLTEDCDLAGFRAALDGLLRDDV